MELDDFKQKCAGISSWAHLATVRRDGTPEIGFMAITPTCVLWLANDGIAGSERWSA